MSGSGNSSNNKRPPPLSLLADENKCTRNPHYYYEDGSTVFQAGSCLFKFQASLLKADTGAEGYRFETIMKRRLGNFAEPNNDPGSSDTNPIILPVDADSFEWFLYPILGRVNDPVVAGFLASPWEPRFETPGFLILHLVINGIAASFGMKKLESWAQSKSQLALESAESIATRGWSQRYLKELYASLQTSNPPELQHKLLVFMQLVLSLAVVAPSDISTEDRTKRLLYCIGLYKTPALATSNPALFGFLFLVVLSLGHRSAVWTEHLTRDDRVILYAAHADLTRLSDHNDLKLDWLNWSIGGKDACAYNCSRNIVKGWEKTFARPKPLDSAIPLEDINHVLALPKHRFAFARETSNQRSQLTCSCAQKFLERIDEDMRELFCGFTRKHETWAR